MTRVSPKVRFRKPRPGAFFQLNFDVLFLIAEYLHPKALLNLSRTCRSLWDFLMDESSAFIWKTARRQVEDLPDCPTDLTEQEYADLVFGAHCHGCGRTARTTLWYMRRRYCRDCKLERLVELSDCDKVIRENNVLQSEDLIIDKESAVWVDIEQLESLLDKYHQSSNKEQFLHDKREECHAIFRHALACQSWRNDQERARKRNLALRRKERHDEIFECLKQHGYGAEIKHFGQSRVRDSYKSAFRTSKPLTDKEWCDMQGEWSRIMLDFRSQRFEKDVYPQRRRLLATEYKTYVTHRSPDTPAFELLPHVADTACFPPFRDIIRTADETQMNDKLFEIAFSQLPTLVDEWRENLDAKVAALVRIPPGLSSGDVATGRVVASSSTTSTQSSQMNTDKLRLACALFYADGGVFAYPEVLSISMRHKSFYSDTEVDSGHADSIEKRLSIRFVAEAPHIIRICGLDPNVATMDDMDRRNARLTWRGPCSHLGPNIRNVVMNWRNAIYRSTKLEWDHDDDEIEASDAPRWQLISDEYIDEIQAIEQSVGILPQDYTRCLLCLPCVGDALLGNEFVEHLACCHDIEERDIKRGVHYIPLGICDSPPVEMVEEGEQVTFRLSRYYRRLHDHFARDLSRPAHTYCCIIQASDRGPRRAKASRMRLGRK